MICLLKAYLRYRIKIVRFHMQNIASTGFAHQKTSARELFWNDSVKAPESCLTFCGHPRFFFSAYFLTGAQSNPWPRQSHSSRSPLINESTSERVMPSVSAVGAPLWKSGVTSLFSGFLSIVHLSCRGICPFWQIVLMVFRPPWPWCRLIIIVKIYYTGYDLSSFFKRTQREIFTKTGHLGVPEKTGQ